ncbi:MULTISPECIES: hypothetical protein [Paenibacillus]|uniref:hypothetical protein n=1 Tax=Paenibacillus TaxID=44249 RepID=UPI0010B7E6E5|nr:MULTISPECIES: hypothetical protein [Paenibacillus]NTZ20091.1 hypothetical protein [Paenibacillus sp. JMULE4]GCL73273.1 hypothetical protein PN4B1_32100 [Paenibacillus naphthalenovorans]
MIQRITAAHLQQLSKEQQEKLREQWHPEEGEYIFYSGQEEMIYYMGGFHKEKALPLLTIGQMLAYLHQYDSYIRIDKIYEEWLIKTSSLEVKGRELCDALWNAMKLIL